MNGIKPVGDMCWQLSLGQQLHACVHALTALHALVFRNTWSRRGSTLLPTSQNKTLLFHRHLPILILLWPELLKIIELFRFPPPHWNHNP